MEVTQSSLLLAIENTLHDQLDLHVDVLDT